MSQDNSNIQNNNSIEKQKPFISCIVPAYNVALYVERCIDSILNQSYQNYEIIIVNDGSTDDTLAIVEKYMNNEHVKLLSQNNAGLSAARNAGIAEASGDYITFIDSDDWVEVDFLKVMVEAVIKYEADIVSVGFTVSDTFVINKYHSENKMVIKEHRCADALFMCEETNYACGKLIHNRLIKSDMFPVGRTYEDIGCIYKIYDKCSKLVEIKDSYYFYFIREDSITSKRSLSNVDDKIYFLEEMADYKLSQNYRYWDYYRLIKCFGIMSDLYKIPDLEKETRKKYINKVYSFINELKLPRLDASIKMDLYWFRAFLLKTHFANLCLSIKYGFRNRRR